MLRAIPALIAVVGMCSVAACSSGSDASDAKEDVTQVSDYGDGNGDADVDAGESSGSSSAAGQVPDAFSDVPLPEYRWVVVYSQGDSTGKGAKMTLSVGDPSMKPGSDDLEADYSELLEADGFKVVGSNELSTQAQKGDLLIDYYSVVDGEIMIEISP